MPPASLFTISLDFELAWGMAAAQALNGYRNHILGARAAVPRLLDMFEHFDVHCTWATVGLLFFDNKEELLTHLPAVRPSYADPSLSSYDRIADLGDDERSDPCHYGLSLIRQIRDRPGQEIGSHTFAHYYCLEDGEDEASFRADLLAAQAAAERIGLQLKSLVFPRNQMQRRYLPLCLEAGFNVFRGTPDIWIYRSRARAKENLWLRGSRLADSYLPLTGPLSFKGPSRHHGMIDVPASMFLRPISSRLQRLDSLRIRRILGGMTHAARTGGLFHLWWHPHNFGQNTEANFAALATVLEHYRQLSETYGMGTGTMASIGSRLAA